jgi:hypothetical protein
MSKNVRAGRVAGILRLLRDLDVQARKAGGAVYMLNGNHESLNVCGDFRCAHDKLLQMQQLEVITHQQLAVKRGATP